MDFGSTVFLLCRHFDPHLHAITVILVHPVVCGQTLPPEVSKNRLVWQNTRHLGLFFKDKLFPPVSCACAHLYPPVYMASWSLNRSCRIFAIPADAPPCLTSLSFRPTGARHTGELKERPEGASHDLRADSDTCGYETVIAEIIVEFSVSRSGKVVEHASGRYLPRAHRSQYGWRPNRAFPVIYIYKNKDDILDSWYVLVKYLYLIPRDRPTLVFNSPFYTSHNSTLFTQMLLNTSRQQISNGQTQFRGAQSRVFSQWQVI